MRAKRSAPRTTTRTTAASAKSEPSQEQGRAGAALAREEHREQDDRDEQGRVDEPGRLQGQRDRHRDAERQREADRREPEDRSAKPREVDLEAAEEEDERQAHERDDGHRVVVVHEPEHRRADGDPGDDLEHDRRQADARREAEQERRRERDDGDDEQVVSDGMSRSSVVGQRAATAIRKTAVNASPGATRRRPWPLRRAFAGAVIGSKQTKSAPAGENTCAAG
jgi:colicin import membrane protein